MGNRLLVAAVVVAAVLAPARAGAEQLGDAAATAQLTVSAASARPGGAVAVTGTGFVLPPVSTCELIWTGPALTGAGCVLGSGPRVVPEAYVPAADSVGLVARLPLDSATDLSPGDYRVTVCAPSCSYPWAGTDSRTVTVAAGEPAGGVSTSSTDAGPALGSSSSSSSSAEPSSSSATSSARPPIHRVTGSGEHAAHPVAPVPPRVTPEPAPPQAAPIARSVALTRAGTGGLTVYPDPALPTDLVRLVDPRLPATGTACVLALDGLPLPASCSAGATGLLQGTLLVPVTTGPGRHLLAACRPDCADPVGGFARRVITVSARSVARVTVPRLTGLTLHQSRAVLRPLHLLLVRRGTATGRIRAQVPAPGARVAQGTTVAVTLSVARRAPTPVRVPTVVGRTVAEARDALAAAGLALVVGPAGTGRIATQQPPAGTLVPPGTAVTVGLTLAQRSSTTSGTGRQLLLGVLLAAVALLAGVTAGYLRSRGRRVRGGPAPHLVAHPDCFPRTGTTIRSPRERTRHLRLQPHLDPAPAIRLEVRR